MSKKETAKSQTSSTPKKKKDTKVVSDFKKAEEERNARQEKFCQLYASDREFFGNGVETYLECYDIDRSKPNWYKTACACASRLLSNAKVFNRINELLDKNGLNDAFVDKQLLFLIQQHEDKGSKVAAIREYNKLKQRITDKLDIKSNGEQIVGFNYIIPKATPNDSKDLNASS